VSAAKGGLRAAGISDATSEQRLKFQRGLLQYLKRFMPELYGLLCKEIIGRITRQTNFFRSENQQKCFFIAFQFSISSMLPRLV